MKDTNTSYILDASFLAAYLLPDEYNPEVNRYFDRYIANEITFLAPVLLDYEILNIIRTAVVSNRLRLEHKDILVNLYQDLAIQTLPINYLEVLNVALIKKLSIYDASYLWLADKMDIPLLTLDAALKGI